MKIRTILISLTIIIMGTVLTGCESDTKDGEVKGDVDIDVPDKAVVVVETSMGEMSIELNGEKAPVSVDNFLKYVEEGYYDGLIFHRVIDEFMVQGGGFGQDLVQKDTRDPIKNEADNGLKNEKYTVSMARTQELDSATSQFFINVADNDFLDHRDDTVIGWGYAVFGKVIEGQEVVDKMKVVETEQKEIHEALPVEPIIIEKIYVKE